MTTPNEARQNAVKASIAAKKRGYFPHPSTSDKIYDKEEQEFILAMHEFIRVSGHKFPTFSEVLRVIRGLGYVKNCLECEARRKRETGRTKNRGA